MSAEEFMNSLTGFDEIAIEKAFGLDILDMPEKRQTAFLRALVFVAKRREGLKDADAKAAALGMTLGEILAAFKADDVEVDPEDPVTEQGKDSDAPR